MKPYALKRLLPIYLITLIVTILLAFIGSRAVSVYCNYTPVSMDRVVIIDAGHGGFDGGATSCSGVTESQLNLEISLRLNDLMHLLGIHTVMIRTSDVSVHTEGETIATKKVSDLKNRVKLVNDTHKSVLVSIHQNYFHDGIYNGAQVFYASTPESRTLAEEIQMSLRTYLDPSNSRETKLARGIYLMENICTPGVLVECGFLSNSDEDKLLQEPIYQKKLASVIAVSVNQYICKNPIA